MLDTLAINSLRVISTEMITNANSGHPGICLGAAPILHTLYTKFLNIDPNHNDFINRDRFILSAGHGSALLYAINHLAGFDIAIEDLKAFRQLNSKTPGHPEYDLSKGIEITTGPLGQGISSAVGFAIAEKYLRNKTNIINYKTYVLCGDGDLQEGVTLEALSLASHLGLENLIILFDSNQIQLDGKTSDTTSVDLKTLLKAYNIEYFLVSDGNNYKNIEATISKALKSNFPGPKFIEIKTVIGFGTDLANTSSVHGKALTKEEHLKLISNLGYNHTSFTFPKEVYNLYKDTLINRSILKVNDFNERLNNAPSEIKAYLELFKNKCFTYEDITFDPNKEISTRVALGKILASYSTINPFMIGGSADLSSSTMVKGLDGNFTSNHIGRNIMFGVREHAMASIVNGLTLSGFNAFSGGFLVFSDYMRPSIRLAALMNLKSVFLFSHDSVLVGEDGPTHQPLEHLSSFRLIPNLLVFRPADPYEMQYVLRLAFDPNFKSGPILITSTRQNVSFLPYTSYKGVSKGAYVVYQHNDFDRIIIASGSEVSLAINCAKRLESKGIKTRVVSMPSLSLFEKQTNDYKELILPKNISKILAIELGTPASYYRYTKSVIGLTEFSKSMPAAYMLDYLGFNEENISKHLENL